MKIDGTIEKIEWAPRSGTQDDHATSYNQFQSIITGALVGQKIKAAIISLMRIANEITELPGYKLYPTKYLFNELNRFLERLQKLYNELTSGAYEGYIQGELGSAIDDYLRIRNLVPGTSYPKSEVVRPDDFGGVGQTEKEGKRLAIESAQSLSNGIDYGLVEVQIKQALTQLHDFSIDRKYPITKHQLALQTAQHFMTFVSQHQSLKQYAEQILETWLNIMYNTWSEVKELDWGDFCRLVISYITGNGSQLVKKVGEI
ncbi:MAG TPA: hypothetical protein VGB17_18980 [Pyrinomonadaceae bacterium]|jgi:hypothetical protein